MEASAQERLQLLSQLARTISHEIYNPLNAILLHIDVLEEEIQDPQEGSGEQLLQSVAVLRTRISQLHELIQEFLTMVRLSEMSRLPENLDALLEAFSLEMREPLEASGITLHLEDVSALGQIAIHKPIFWRGLQGLVQYTIQAMPQGGNLALHGKRDRDCVQLDIILRGENLHRVHELTGENLFQLGQHTGQSLGLYLVYEIVTAHGGQLSVQNTSAQAMTLTMRLPLLMPEGAHKSP